jgi:hypothetical protein
MGIDSTMRIDVVSKLKKLMETRYGSEYAIMEVACEQIEYLKQALARAEANASYWETQHKLNLASSLPSSVEHTGADC